MIWWIDNPERSASERLSVESLAGSEPWLQIVAFRLDGTRICWDIDIVTERRTYPLTLRYPDFFPGSPPSVMPRGVRERWSFHQYGAGGELCLEIGPDNWEEHYTGADMLQSAYKLLAGEEVYAAGGPDVGSRHTETLGQQLRTRTKRVFLPLAIFKAAANLDEFESKSASAVVMYRHNAQTYVIASIGDGDDVIKAPLPQVLVSSTFSIPTTILRWPTTHAMPSPDEISSFRADFENAGIDIANSQCLILIQGDDILAFDLFFATGVGRLATIVEPELSPRLDQEHQRLADRKVAIVGCGSMGSKVATMLARSGVGEFVLVDDDLLLPENLVRNDLDWREVALHKVDALAGKLELVHPTVSCKRYRRSLGGQEATGSIENLIGVLAKCDLIIDATADTDSFTYLGSLAKVAKCSMIWAEIFAGGFGGFIARYRAGIEPNPMTMRHLIYEWCNAQGQRVPMPTGRYESTEAKPAIADDAEVSAISSHLALFALDALLERVPTSYPYAVYMIGLRAGWIFDQPFEVRPIDVGGVSGELGGEASIEQKQAEIEQILNLMSEYPNADSSTN